MKNKVLIQNEGPVNDTAFLETVYLSLERMSSGFWCI